MTGAAVSVHSSLAARAGILRSSLRTSLKRYGRSKALWLMLLSAPIAARFMIGQEQGQGVTIAIGNQLPVLTSAVLGIWLGIVVSTLVLPIAYIYLRANTTRRQPWQIEEVTAGSRVAIALGRFMANAAILFGMLAMLSLAGLFLGWLMVTGPWRPLEIVGLLWLVAAPAFLAVAAIHILFDAIPALRGAWGDTAFFVLWMASMVIAMVAAENPSSFAAGLADVGGAIRPLVDGAPAGSTAFAIGSGRIDPGRVELDVWKGIGAEGYLASRAAWVVLSFAIAALAGLLYRPHRTTARKRRFAWLRRLNAANLLPRAVPGSAPAAPSGAPMAGLTLAELRLIAAGPLFLPLAAAALAAGFAPDFRHVGSPAGLLLLVFALSAHAGRTEAKGLLALTGTAAQSPWLRRVAFVLAGTVWAVILALPAIATQLSAQPLLLALGTGAAISGLAIGLAAMSGSAFVARMVLLIVWYGYFAS